MTPAEIVEALRLARLDRTLSLRAVCAATGVPVSSLSEWEWRRHDPTLSSLDRWARALGFELTLTPIAPDRSTCPYFQTRGKPDQERGLCSFGCTDEPACITSEPDAGWPGAS